MQVHGLQLCQVMKLAQAGIGDDGIVEIQPTEPRQPVQMRQAGIGDTGPRQAQSLQRFQPVQVSQVRVGDSPAAAIHRAPQVHPDERPDGRIVIPHDHAPEPLEGYFRPLSDRRVYLLLAAPASGRQATDP
jgi:hypothetical protein